jgi:hypothetical protein
MKLVFSEHRADYGNYVFPYAVWAFPESGETPADLFEAGFLPSSRQLDRFYLCRQVRVSLGCFSPSSENRRILRKGAGIEFQLVPREEFTYTAQRRDFMMAYADARFGPGVMTAERLESLFHSPITSHVMVFIESASGREVGLVTLFQQGPRMAYYYYGFYDLSYASRSLGLYMMTSAVDHFANKGVSRLFLGTCYSANALYKTQFAGAEFFNGFRWSSNLEELKYLIRRDGHEGRTHLLENEEYQTAFQIDLGALSDTSLFAVKAVP